MMSKLFLHSLRICLRLNGKLSLLLALSLHCSYILRHQISLMNKSRNLPISPWVVNIWLQLIDSIFHPLYFSDHIFVPLPSSLKNSGNIRNKSTLTPTLITRCTLGNRSNSSIINLWITATRASMNLRTDNTNAQ